MASDKEVYEAMKAMVHENIPESSIRFKDGVWYEKLIGVFLSPFNADFMTRYTTTLGYEVHFPSKAFVESNYGSAWRILAHEYVHLSRSYKRLFAFVLKYAFPPIAALLALGAIGAIWTPWLWLSLLALLFAVPWPVKTGRADEELYGYAMNLAIAFWLGGPVAMRMEAERIVPQFTGWAYIKMWPNEDAVRAALRTIMSEIETGKFFERPGAKPYLDVRGLLVQMGEMQE